MCMAVVAFHLDGSCELQQPQGVLAMGHATRDKPTSKKVPRIQVFRVCLTCACV